MAQMPVSSPGDLWTVRLRVRSAKLVVCVLDTSERGVRLRDVTRQPLGEGTWYNTADVEFCERLGDVGTAYLDSLNMTSGRLELAR